MTPTTALSADNDSLGVAEREEALSAQELRRTIFALEKLFHQKPATCYFDPRTDGMQMGHKAEIGALKRKIADDSRKHSELKEQVSTALSVLVDAQEERDRLQVELDRRDATEQQLTGFLFRRDKDAAQVSSSSDQSRVTQHLEELYIFSCDPHVQKSLQQEEEKRLIKIDDDDAVSF